MRILLSIMLFVALCSTIFVGYGVVEGEVSLVENRNRRVNSSPAVDATLESLFKMQLDGDRDSSLQYLWRAVEADSSYAPAHYQLAKIKLTEYAADSALYYAKNAYLLDTTNYWYLSCYAQATLTKGNYPESKVLFSKILKDKPRDINAYRIMALLLQQESKHEEAIALLDSAELKVGQNPYLLAIKRQLLIGTNQTQRAIDELNALIEQIPYDPSNYIALGDIYTQIGLDSLAERAYMKSYELDSLSVEILVSIANFYQRRGDKDKYLNYVAKIVDNDNFGEPDKVTLVKELASGKSTSRAKYDQDVVLDIMASLVDQYPQNDEMLMTYLREFIAANRGEMVFTELRRVVDRGDATLKSYKLLINMLGQSKAVDSVKLYIDQALIKFPEDQSLHFDWIYALAYAEMYERSIEYIDQRIDASPDSLKLELFGLKADQHERLSKVVIEGESDAEQRKRYKSNMKMVYSIYKKILKYDPENILIMNNYAYTLSQHGGDLVLAEKLARKVMESSGENAVYIDTHGWILYRLGRLEEAKVELRRAMTLDKSNNPEILLHFAEVLFALKEDVMGEYYLEKAKESGATSEEVSNARESGKAVAAKENNNKSEK